MKTLTLLPLAAALIAGAAFADGRSARLLDDTPRLALASAPRLVDTALGVDVTKSTTPISYMEHLAKTTAAGVFATTAGVIVAYGLGTLSSTLIWTAIPVLLSHLFIPPVLTVLAALLMGNWDSPGRFGFWMPFAGTFLVNAAVFVVASLFLTVPWTNPVALLLYTLVDGLLMGGTTVGLMHLFEKKPAATATLRSFVPGVSDTNVVPLVKVAL